MTNMTLMLTWNRFLFIVDNQSLDCWAKKTYTLSLRSTYTPSLTEITALHINIKGRLPSVLHDQICLRPLVIDRLVQMWLVPCLCVYLSAMDVPLTDAAEHALWVGP